MSSYSDPLTIRLPLDVLDKVNELAAVSQRSRSWVILRALRHYVKGEGHQILAVAASRRSALEEGTESLDDVIADLEKIVAGPVAKAG